MAIPLIPWEPHCFPNEIQAELRRRSINRGLNPVNESAASWGGDDDDWNTYRGPMTAWVRVLSNGYGVEHPSTSDDMPGFVLYGGKDFYSSYGINRGDVNTDEYRGTNLSVIGYTPKGVPHIIENSLVNSDYPIHVPNPEIERISANIQKELLRRVRIEWTCFSFKQLEYMTPYFLVPGLIVSVEWGWNHFNPQSLMDLQMPEKEMMDLFENPYPLYIKNVLGSRGNYEVLFGIISNFEWSIEGNKIKCVTEVTSKDRFWSGQIIGANMVQNTDAEVPDESRKNEDKKPILVIDSLKKFIVGYIDKFKDFADQGSKTADQILDEMSTITAIDQPNTGDQTNMKGLIDYVKAAHPNNYKSYLFGVFTGREKNTLIGANVDDDFDCKDRENTWINMGLVVELINFHSSHLEGLKDQQSFKIDIDDCIIGGHPNLISTNGYILLIPNAFSPKYFSGTYGKRAVVEKSNVSMLSEFISPQKQSISDEYAPMETATIDSFPIIPWDKLDRNKTSPSLDFANYRLRKIANQLKIMRDDISVLINANRIKYSSGDDKFEFPFARVHYDLTDGIRRTYDAYFTGFLKNLYINIEVLKGIVKDDSVITYKQFYDALFNAINSAASNFWRFQIEAGSGRKSTTGLATMKIVDENLTQYTSNDGPSIFTFDLNAADGLLQSVNFRPMLSNAQGIRAMFAQTNADNKHPVVISDNNQLLDYHFKDRLRRATQSPTNTKANVDFATNTYKSSMAKLQAVKPLNGVFQISTETLDKKKLIRRLAIPSEHAEILTLLLDDQDQNHNPRYCGIMPGIQAEFTLQGIAGIRTFAMFRVRGLPQPYSEDNIVFRVINVNDSLQNGQWVTTIVAGVLPLRGYFRSKLRLPMQK